MLLVLLVVGVVRLYLDPIEPLPDHLRARDVPAVVDVMPEQARATARSWKRRGFRVLMVAL